MLSFLLLTLTTLLLPPSQAHFLLNTPPTIGFDDSLESTPPCGSFTPNLSSPNLTSFHVGGDAIALTSTHPAATWLFRATLDPTASGNWTTLREPVAQTGLGDYCETDVEVPGSWVGEKGVVGVVQDAVDGLLYQVGFAVLVSLQLLSFHPSFLLFFLFFNKQMKRKAG